MIEEAHLKHILFTNVEQKVRQIVKIDSTVETTFNHDSQRIANGAQHLTRGSCLSVPNMNFRHCIRRTCMSIFDAEFAIPSDIVLIHSTPRGALFQR